MRLVAGESMAVAFLMGRSQRPLQLQSKQLLTHFDRDQAFSSIALLSILRAKTETAQSIQ